MDRSALKYEDPWPRIYPHTLEAESPHWYTPWLDDITCAPDGLIQCINCEKGGARQFDSGWSKDATGSGLLSAAAGLATSVTLQRLGLDALLANAGGTISSYYRTFVGLQVQERIYGQIVRCHAVYGKYRVNLFSSKVVAARFDRRGTSYNNFVKPLYYQQRVVTEDGTIVYTHPPLELPLIGIEAAAAGFPERSFGMFD